MYCEIRFIASHLMEIIVKTYNTSAAINGRAGVRLAPYKGTARLQRVQHDAVHVRRVGLLRHSQHAGRQV